MRARRRLAARREVAPRVLVDDDGHVMAAPYEAMAEALYADAVPAEVPRRIEGRDHAEAQAHARTTCRWRGPARQSSISAIAVTPINAVAANGAHAGPPSGCVCLQTRSHGRSRPRSKRAFHERAIVDSPKPLGSTGGVARAIAITHEWSAQGSATSHSARVERRASRSAAARNRNGTSGASARNPVFHCNRVNWLAAQK